MKFFSFHKINVLDVSNSHFQEYLSFFYESVHFHFRYSQFIFTYKKKIKLIFIFESVDFCKCWWNEFVKCFEEPARLSIRFIWSLLLLLQWLQSQVSPSLTRAEYRQTSLHIFPMGCIAKQSIQQWIISKVQCTWHSCEKTQKSWKSLTLAWHYCWFGAETDFLLAFGNFGW